MYTYKEFKKRRKEKDALEQRNEDARDAIESIVNYIHGEKYRNPRDENELGFNRGIDTAIRNIRDNFL